MNSDLIFTVTPCDGVQVRLHEVECTDEEYTNLADVVEAHDDHRSEDSWVEIQPTMANIEALEEILTMLKRREI